MFNYIYIYIYINLYIDIKIEIYIIIIYINFTNLIVTFSRANKLVLILLIFSLAQMWFCYIKLINLLGGTG